MTHEKKAQSEGIPGCYDCAGDAAGRLKQMFVDIAQARRIKLGQTPAERPVFRKLHGVAHGRLEVRADLPDDLKVGVFAMGSLTPDGGAWLIDSVIVDERWVYDGPLWLPRQGRSLTVWYDSTVAAPAMQAAYLDALAGSPRIRPEDYEACPACGRWVTPEERVLQDGEVGCEGCTEADHGAPDVDVGVPEGIAPA